MTWLEACRARYPGAAAYRLGNNAQLCDALITLVRMGRKRAILTSQAEIDAGETPAELGRCDLVTDFDDAPQLVIRTVEICRFRFPEMTEEKVHALGVYDTLPAWRVGHRRYYRAMGIFDPEMALIWERFELVEDLA